MIAAIPNVIGWLAISFAKVSLPDCPCLKCRPVQNAVQESTVCLIPSWILFVGFFVSLHGKVVGRVWRRNNLVHGNDQLFNAVILYWNYVQRVTGS